MLDLSYGRLPYPTAPGLRPLARIAAPADLAASAARADCSAPLDDAIPRSRMWPRLPPVASLALVRSLDPAAVARSQVGSPSSREPLLPAPAGVVSPTQLRREPAA